ncbi:hypothetical protein OIDMADRAFT_162966 [Oidiodendron maius Zn]|uniref:RING-type domain-containing protein n=1 Tax=Oidiodendron maius (strain Zn) TaxID=913774 RepID=A0A0C3CPK1_OIDMZ|nr:hypothetical protein OIDMADRAFT_162966 [Oidiodendron maius Zn]
MKFGRRFRIELLEQGFPQHWVDSAVPYAQLKKVINKVCLELQEYGLDIAALAQMPPVQDEAPQCSGGSIRRGSWDGSKEEFRPKLTLFFEDDQAVDAALSHDTRAFLKNRMQQQGRPGDLVDNANQERDNTSTDGPVLRQVEIPLTFDTEFFGLLHEDVSHLDALQAKEQQLLTREIHELSKEISALAKPSKFGKSDMYAWRQLFDLYLQAAVFFSTQETNTGSRSPTFAAQQLEWFQNEVTKRGLVGIFNLPASHRALDKFVKINIALLRNMRFLEINQIAIGKILKKFDKRTNLGITEKAPKFIQVESLMPQTIAKAVCSQVTQDLIKITPQLDDYLCPVCFTIAWRPIRLKCSHMLCVLCAITLQNAKRRRCPLCRRHVIQDATEDDYDADFAKFLKKYFPKEIKNKQVDLQNAAGEEKFGIYYSQDSGNRQCQVM